MDRQLVLAIRILEPRCTDVWCTIVDDQINLVVLAQLVANGGAALLRRDVLHQRHALGDRLDRRQVDADDDRILGHVLARDLHPRARRGAEVEAALGLGEEVVLLVELQQLERRTRPIPALLGQVVEFVEALLGDLVLSSERRRTKVGASARAEKKSGARPSNVRAPFAAWLSKRARRVARSDGLRHWMVGSCVALLH